MKVPIVLEDLAGRRVNTEASIDVKQFVAALPMVPVGAIVFWRTEEKDAGGRRIFRQAPQPAPTAAELLTPAASSPTNGKAN